MPAAFALHVLEEAPGFTAWAKRFASERYAQRDFVRNNVAGFLMTLGTTAALARRPVSRPTFFLYYSLVLVQQALWNTAFHAGATVKSRTYSPGLVTAVALFLPLWVRVSRDALREELLSPQALLAGTALGGVVHAAAVARQVFFVGGGEPQRGL